MSTPVLLVTGFLGAGKTTAINALLQNSQGERIAAIVNDFGAINVDAELLEGAADAVVGLKNGCICCTLQGDLLRTLRLVLAHDPPPERIVIEASGAADPRGIAEMVLDPVLWGVVSLDAIACVIDAEDCLQTPARMQDRLWRAQIENADFALLTKTAGLAPAALVSLRARLAVMGKPSVDLDAEGLPMALLTGRPQAPRAAPGPERVSADRFVTLEWQSTQPIRAEAFREGLGKLSVGLLRAKGWLAFTDEPGASHLFQLVGRRATFSPAETRADQPPCRLVLIGERGEFDLQAAKALLDQME